jgi:hypothetical protein
MYLKPIVTSLNMKSYRYFIFDLGRECTLVDTPRKHQRMIYLVWDIHRSQFIPSRLGNHLYDQNPAGLRRMFGK